MSEPLHSWLQAWGEWLDAALATGLGSLSQDTCGRIQAWCADAELLGFSAQAAQALCLLQGNLRAQQRHQAFTDLLLEQDMLVRLDATNRLLASGKTVATAAIEQQSE
jgi:hypothetical protein